MRVMRALEDTRDRELFEEYLRGYEQGAREASSDAIICMTAIGVFALCVVAFIV